MMPRCLVVHPGALGDVLLAGPALQHLAALGFRTTLAAAPRLVPLFEGSGLVDGACDLEGLGLHRLFVEPPDRQVLDALARFGALVCWLGAGDSTFRSNLGLVGRPTVVGRAAPPPGAGLHVSRHLLETLAPLGPLPTHLPQARLGVAEADRARAGAWLATRGIGLGEAIVLQAGAGSPRKMWPGFVDLARRLHEATLPLVALAGPADGAVVEALVLAGMLTEDRVARDWPLPEMAGLLSLARAAVGNDSGPTHLAAAVGRPTLAIFGPTDAAAWAPLGAHVRVVAGRPGDTPWGSVDRVEAALWAFLAGAGADAVDDPAPAAARHAWP